MVKYTPNYNLSKPDGTDMYSVLPQNDNMDILDIALKDLDESKATSANLAVLEQRVTDHLEQSKMVEVYRRNGINQTLLSGVGMDLAFTIRDTLNSNADFSEITVDGKIKFNRGGLYLYTIRAIFLKNPIGTRTLTLTYNGNGLSTEVKEAHGSDVTSLSISQLIKVNKNDIVGAALFQNSGVSLDIAGDDTQTFLQLVRLGG